VGRLLEDVCTFKRVPRSFLLRMRNVSDKILEKIRTHISCSVIFGFENREFYEIMLKKSVEQGRPQITKRRMLIACWIPTATNTQSGCVILYLLLFHCTNRFTYASQCYVMPTLPVLIPLSGSDHKKHNGLKIMEIFGSVIVIQTLYNPYPWLSGETSSFCCIEL